MNPIEKEGIMHKMSQDLDTGDFMKAGGLTIKIDNVLRNNLEKIVEIDGHLWISPKHEISVTLPYEIPIKTPKNG